LGNPFRIVGGIGLFGLITVGGDAVAEYGLEAVVKDIYQEPNKTEFV
jgi:hypothetical protein